MILKEVNNCKNNSKKRFAKHILLGKKLKELNQRTDDDEKKLLEELKT